jgi:hypothetical protein
MSGEVSKKRSFIMKRALVLASLLAAGSASADWADATGGSPAYPQICIFNETPYSVDVAVNGQRMYVGPSYTTRIQSYQNGPSLVQLNTRQLSGPYANPIWAQAYVNPAYYGCTSQNSISIFLYGNVLGLR